MITGDDEDPLEESTEVPLCEECGMRHTDADRSRWHDDLPKEEVRSKIQFTNRRVISKVGRTIKTSESKYEFSKFDVGFEADIPDGVSRQDAADVIFKELMTESILREAAIRAAAKDPTILDRVVIILKAMIENQEANNEKKGI